MYRALFILFLLLAVLVPVAEGQAQRGGAITPCATPPADMTVTAVSSNFQIPACGGILIVFNNSAVDARFRLGSASTTTALTTDALVPAKTFVVLNVGTGRLYFAAITASGTSTLSFIQGLV